MIQTIKRYPHIMMGGEKLLKKCRFCENGRASSTLLTHPICNTCTGKLGKDDRLLKSLRLILKEL